MAWDGGVWLGAGCVSCGGESTDSRTLEELVVCSGPHEGGVCTRRTRLLAKVSHAILLKRMGGSCVDAKA